MRVFAVAALAVSSMRTRTTVPVKARIAILIVATIAAAPALTLVAKARFSSAAPATRQLEFSGPIRGFTQDADSITLRLSLDRTPLPRRVTVASAKDHTARVSAEVRMRQTHVTLKLPPALASAPGLLITVSPGEPPAH